MMMKAWLALGIVGASLAGTAANAQQARDAAPKDIQSWAGKIQQNYPAAALQNSEEGTVSMELEIDARGSVRACSVTSSSGSVALDKAACAGMIEYARYEPALNDAGKPVAVSQAQSIRYILPDTGSSIGMAMNLQPPSPLDERGLRDRVFDADFATALEASPDRRALFALTIDSNGRPTGCGMLFSSGDSALDIRTCQALVENAEFKPAQASDDENIPGIFVLSSPGFEIPAAARP